MAKIIVHSFEEFIDARCIETAAEVGLIESVVKNMEFEDYSENELYSCSRRKIEGGEDFLVVSKSCDTELRLATTLAKDGFLNFLRSYEFPEMDKEEKNRLAIAQCR